MKYATLCAVAAIALAMAAPASAGPLPEGGVSYEQVTAVLTERGLPATAAKDSAGMQIIKTRISDVNFDVYFYKCTANVCREIQFAAGWSNSKVAAARINEWNTTKRMMRAYSKPGKVLFVEQDIVAASSSTESIKANLDLWRDGLGTFKSFMKL